MRFMPVVMSLVISAVCTAQTERPEIRPARIGTPPRIDGRLDDPVWASIDPITDFRQQEPKEGNPLSERTEVRICYDNSFLYVGIRAFDREASSIAANVFERDGEIQNDDSFSVFIDSYRDSRTSYAFFTNSIGTQVDGQQGAAGELDKTWDAIWFAKTSLDGAGFSIEMAIPFYSLRFKEGEEVEMGILLQRRLARRNEWGYWPALSREYKESNIEMYARLGGLSGIERGVNVQVKPYLLAGIQQTNYSTEREGDVGLDMKWGITPSLTADLTVNTDFAQVESDSLQVNMSRFSLFYPEKRDFFTESNRLFSFGIPREAEVFFSRRIGIRGQSAVPILGGARVYGLVGDTNIGLLSIQADERRGVATENFSVARLKQNILDRSYIGGIFTSRSGHEPNKDISAGVDFAHYFGPSSAITGSLARSGNGAGDGGNWFGALSLYRNSDRYEAKIDYIDIGPNFDPGIGFVMRPNQRTVNLHGAFKPRPDAWNIRQLTFAADYSRTENYDGLCESLYVESRNVVNFQSNDVLTFPIIYQEEYLPYTFEMVPGALIPPGKYTYWQSWPYIRFSPSRKVSGTLAYAQGGFYNGYMYAVGESIDCKLNPRFQFSLSHTQFWYSLPSKNFQLPSYTAEMSYYFSPRLTTRVVAQYEGYYKDLLMNVRLRWIYAPESEVWIVYDEGHRFGLPDPSLKNRTLLMKVVYNFNL